jgi:FlaA1/EpsC-like NDP-sugar epimerase
MVLPMKQIYRIRNRFVLIGDLILIILVVILSYALRLELGDAFWFYSPSMLWMIGVALVIKPLVYYEFGLYRRLWIYASVQELKLIAGAVVTASLVVAVTMISLFNLRVFYGFPRSVLAIDMLASILAVGGLRFTLRLLAENKTNPNIAGIVGNAKRVLIVGAGDAGALVVRELTRNPQLKLVPIGFLDDNPDKQKNQLLGVPVIGGINEMAEVLDTHKVDEVIIAIPSAAGSIVRRVADICRLKGVQFRTMPGIYELLGGMVNVSRLREVDITDLLRRDVAHIDDELVGASLKDKVVMVTGAGGSIGREICRQSARWAPSKLILLGHGENSIFESLIELKENYPSLDIHPVIADIRDLDRLRSVFNVMRPNVVFHAAAHKHVPMMEINVEDAVTNNIMGTRNVVRACEEFDVERLVMISTDKAIRPINVMGATKRMAEMIILDSAQRTHRPYSIVRFGNVLGSRGSVVPLFKRQIARGGPITITHPDMKRYFMTIPEAVHLVLQSSAMGKGGEVYMLNMGQQIRILDLAEDLIRLSGLEPGRDIEIVFTNIRPGEKLSEDLWEEGNTLQKTSHPDIYQLNRDEGLNGEKLEAAVDELISLAEHGEADQIILKLDELIPGSKIQTTSPLDLTAIL